MPVNHDAPLVSREPLAGAYVLLTFRHPEVAAQARAGQFVMIKAGTSAEPPLRRPFSIMTVDPAAGTFTLFLKAVGGGSRALADLGEGEVAQCLGPLGRSFPMPPPGVEPVLVAGGYGIAPFFLFSQELRREGRSPRIFYGGRTAGDLQVRSPFAELEVPVECSTDDGSLGSRGRVTEPLERYLDRARGPVVLFACGPDPMLYAVARVAERRDLPAHVSLDPWMGCGVGTCLGCVVWIQEAGDPRPRYRIACTDGPVFDARDVVWWTEPGSSSRRRMLAAAGPRSLA